MKQVHFPDLPEKGDVSDFLDMGKGQGRASCSLLPALRPSLSIPKAPVIGTAADFEEHGFPDRLGMSFRDIS